MKFLTVSKIVTILILLFASPAFAGGFAEAFKEFVLGSEAEAYSPPYDSSLDETAEACINCHNGVTATHITIKNAEAPIQVRGFKTINHPVGMPYDYYAHKEPGAYRSRSLLDANIRFVDGKVTCISCHELKSDELQGVAYASNNLSGNGDCTASKQLTIGPRETDLCMACHVK